MATATTIDYFTLGGAALNELAGTGDAGAQAELDRRAAKRAEKTVKGAAAKAVNASKAEAKATVKRGKAAQKAGRAMGSGPVTRAGKPAAPAATVATA